MKYYNSVYFIYHKYIISDISSYLPTLSVILQPIQEYWEQLGLQLNIDQSVLTDIRNKGDSTEQMKYLLEEWSLKGGTLTQLEDALLCLGKKEVISGMLYMIVSTSILIYQLVKALFHMSSFIVRFTCSTREGEYSY